MDGNNVWSEDGPVGGHTTSDESQEDEGRDVLDLSITEDSHGEGGTGPGRTRGSSKPRAKGSRKAMKKDRYDARENMGCREAVAKPMKN